VTTRASGDVREGEPDGPGPASGGSAAAAAGGRAGAGGADGGAEGEDFLLGRTDREAAEAEAAAQAQRRRERERGLTLMERLRKLDADPGAPDEAGPLSFQDVAELVRQEDEMNPGQPLTPELLRRRHAEAARAQPEGGWEKGLTHVHLDRERLDALDSGVLAGLAGATNLYLQHNRLSSVAALTAAPCLSRLRFLTLAHNRLASLEGLKNLWRLKFLDLSHNRLDAEAADPTGFPQSLVFLKLAGNPCVEDPAAEARVRVAFAEELEHLSQLDGREFSAHELAQAGYDVGDAAAGAGGAGGVPPAEEAEAEAEAEAELAALGEREREMFLAIQRDLDREVRVERGRLALAAGGAALQEDAGQFRRALPDLMDPARDNATVLDSLMHGPRRELEAQSQVSWRAMGPLVVPSASLWAQPGLGSRGSRWTDLGGHPPPPPPLSRLLARRRRCGGRGSASGSSGSRSGSSRPRCRPSRRRARRTGRRPRGRRRRRGRLGPVRPSPARARPGASAPGRAGRRGRGPPPQGRPWPRRRDESGRRREKCGRPFRGLHS